MKCDTCKMKHRCDALERIGKLSKQENCRCYSQAKPISNADKIKRMSDWELAELLVYQELCPDGVRRKSSLVDCHARQYYGSCEDCWLAWLKQEVQNATD